MDGRRAVFLWWKCRARFLSLGQSKLRLYSANHRPGYWSNLPCDWPGTAWAYYEQVAETKASKFWACGKLRLCSANHRPDYWSNLPCEWPSIAWAYFKQQTENGPRSGTWMSQAPTASKLNLRSPSKTIHWNRITNLLMKVYKHWIGKIPFLINNALTLMWRHCNHATHLEYRPHPVSSLHPPSTSQQRRTSPEVVSGPVLALLEIRLEHLFKHRRSGTENNARCLNVLLFNNKNDFVLKKQNIDIKLMFYLIRSIMHNKLSSANCKYGIWGSLHKDLSPQHFEPMRCQVFHFTGYYFGVWFAIYHWIVTS